MGMYDHLNNISRQIEQQEKAKEKELTKVKKEQFKKYELLLTLNNIILNYSNKKLNYYEYKNQIIKEVLEIAEKENNLLENNYNFSFYFLDSSFLAQCSKVERLQKAEAKKGNELKKQKEAEELQKLQKLQELQKKDNTKKTFKNIFNCFYFIFKIIFLIFGRFHSFDSLTSQQKEINQF